MVLIAAVLVGVISIGALVSGVVSGTQQIKKSVEEENRRSQPNSRRGSESNSSPGSLLLRKYTDVY
jgi:hypothetical protein